MTMLSEELSKLKTLYDEGALSSEEYTAAKARLIKQDQPENTPNNLFVQPLFGMTASQYALWMHLSLYAITSGFGCIIPILLWYHSKGHSEFIDDHRKSIANFVCSYSIYLSVISCIYFIWLTSILTGSSIGDYNSITFWVGFPILLLQIFFISTAILPVFGAIAANSNKPFCYPLTIQFIR
jgi:uncharacterized Tic20 family protein